MTLAETRISNDSCAAKNPAWVTGFISTPVGTIPRVKTQLDWGDTAGRWMVRWGINRMGYTVRPGLYAVGNPCSPSPVFVSANYKLSFDILRKNLAGIDAWILVLDTKGINVWCAAGKGTFGTREIITRVAEARLRDLVSHRTLILPQLGAPGVTARQVTKATGFKPVFGPVRAADIPAFLQSGMKASPKMRRVLFPARDRLVLTPVELVGSMKYIAAIFAVLFFMAFISPAPFSWSRVINETLYGFIPLLLADLTGAVITPFLLPWIPGRPFAWKGALTGFFMMLILIAASPFGFTPESWIGRAALLCLGTAFSSFLALNFTGCTPFTSLSGVDREMKKALPLLIITSASGILLLMLNKFVVFI